MTLIHYLALALFLFVLGACVGSFLNVLIFRIPRRQSLIRPGSRCPRCLAAIAPWDNVPILGWLMLGGRCRGCRLPISARYPGVEALVAMLFVGVFCAEAAVGPGDIVDRGLLVVGSRLVLELSLGAILVALAFMALDLTRSEMRDRAGARQQSPDPAACHLVGRSPGGCMASRGVDPHRADLHDAVEASDSIALIDK